MQLRAKLGRLIGHLYRGKGAQRLVRLIYCPPVHSSHQRLQTNISGIDGTAYYVDTASFIEWHVYAFGGYETSLQKAMLEKLPPNGVFIDCGANIGIHTCAVARQKPESTVVAIEPVSHLRERLNANVELNQLDNVIVMPVAVGEHAGEIEIFLPHADAMNQGQASLSKRSHLDSQGVTVPIETLDQISKSLELATVSVIKIDVEGHELQVLKGAREVIMKHRPIIYFEYDSEIEGFSDIEWDPLEQVLHDLDYQTTGEIGGKMKVAEPLTILESDNGRNG